MRILPSFDRLQSERASRSGDTSEDPEQPDELEPLTVVRHVLKSQPFHGINRKVQLKPSAWERGSPDDPSGVGAPTEALFILKWGGELTSLGEAQAASLGALFRNSFFPAEGGGFLRLHSTYRHDLKIYSSDEGRVQMTAAAFARPAGGRRRPALGGGPAPSAFLDRREAQGSPTHPGSAA